MFKQPNEENSVKGLINKAMGEQVDCKISFWVPLFIAVVFSGISLGVLSLVLSMDLLDLLFDRGKQLKLRIWVPVGSFLFAIVASYLYFCVIYHVMNRRNLLQRANLTFRKTTYEIF
jgi:hypothetical protein